MENSIEEAIKKMEKLGVDWKNIFDVSEVDKWREIEKSRLAFSETKGYEKIQNYLKDLTKNPEFTEAIKEARKVADIPSDGFDDSIEIAEMNNILKCLGDNEEYLKSVENIAERYELSPFRESVASYILFNNFNYLWEAMPVNVIKTMDVGSMFTKEEGEPEFAVAGKLGAFMFFSKMYPIGIFIHPYMSQRDIIDAVKKIYKSHIEPLQKKYRKEGIKLGTARKKSERVEERNKFISENRTMPMKKLIGAVREKFGDLLDYTTIYKIIRDERKIRK